MPFNEVEPLLPSVRIATDITLMRAQSLLMAGVERPIVDAIADPLNHAHIEAVIDQMYIGRRQYFGVMLGRQVVAYSEVSPWLVVDQAPFAGNTFAHMALQAIDVVNDGDMPGRPVGIHTLAMRNDYNERIDAARSLVNHAIYHADGREMRAAPVDRDPALAVLLDAEFKSMPKHAHIDGAKRRLYIRNAGIRSALQQFSDTNAELER
jgi:hypothetical protein